VYVAWSAVKAVTVPREVPAAWAAVADVLTRAPATKAKLVVVSKAERLRLRKMLKTASLQATMNSFAIDNRSRARCH
jgi:hypothetical protein